MESTILLIQGGLLGVAALNLATSVWLLYRQARLERLARVIEAHAKMAPPMPPPAPPPAVPLQRSEITYLPPGGYIPGE